MLSPSIPDSEFARLAAIERYRLSGRGREAEFDRVTELAAEMFGVAASTVSIVSAEEQCFRGAAGIDIWGTPREVAFCGHTILSEDVMVVEDASKDPRFRDNPLVTGDPHIRFYAGAPLKVGGEILGTLCLFDPNPRSLAAHERARLERLACLVADLVEARVGRLTAQEHRELLTLTVENVVEGVALVDGRLRMVLWNRAFCDMFGYEPGLVKEGMSAADLIMLTASRGDLGEGDPAEIVRGFVQSIMNSESRRIEIRRKNGRILDIWRKTITGGRFIMTARDVTEERQIARLKDELVSTVSHELRTPLTAISASLGLMASGSAGELPPKARHLVGIAHKNSDRLIRLVNDLLDMDKLRSGKVDFDFAELDLNRVVQEAVEQNRPYAGRFGVTITAELSDEPLVASVDESRLLQVLTNLLSNAAKFAPAGSEVRVRLCREGRNARISVIDQGPGIPREFRARLFDRFAQADQSSQRGQAGTGLGLAITRNIVERHGGRIALATDTKAGATFHVDLPLSAGRQQAARTVARTPL